MEERKNDDNNALRRVGCRVFRQLYRMPYIIRDSAKRNRRDVWTQSQASICFYACVLADDALIPMN